MVQRAAAYLFIVLIPFSVSVPLMPPLARGVLPLFVTPGLEAADLVALLLLLSVALEPQPAAANARRRQASLVAPLALLAVLGFVGASSALSPPLALYSATRWLFAAGVCWALARAEIRQRRLVAVLVLVLIVHAVIGVAQVLKQTPLGLSGEMALSPGAEGASVVTIGTHRWLRAYGLTFHPNVLGGYLAVSLVLALPLLDRLLWRLAWGILFFGMLATFSRSAGLATGLCVPASVLWLWRHQPHLRRGLGITLAGAVCIALVAGWVWRDRLSTRLGVVPVEVSSSPRSATAILERLSRDVADRVQMNRFALGVTAAHPLVGIGAGNMPLAFMSVGRRADYVHNVPLLLAAEVGIFGALIWLWLLIGAGALLRNAQPRPDPWLVVAVAAFVELQIIALFDCYPWSLNAGRMLTATVLAMILSSSAGDAVGLPASAAELPPR